MDALAFGCIPIVIADSYIFPFSEVIDWKRAALHIYEDDLPKLMDIVRGISFERIAEMRESGIRLYSKYFSSLEKITLTTLKIINDRVFQHQSGTYPDWNELPSLRFASPHAFTLPIGPPRSQGFTAVVLTYDRIESLFKVLDRISNVPSLAKIVVVWNNQQKDPPPSSAWPKLSKPLQVFRFFPFYFITLIQ